MNQRLLIAEDGDDIRQLLQIAFEREGYEVTAASDGAEALRYYGGALREFKPFACLITDCAMPNMTGPRMASRVRELGDALPIVFVTAHARSLLADDITRYNIADVFEKPLDLSSLTARVGVLLAGAAAAAAVSGDASDLGDDRPC